MKKAPTTSAPLEFLFTEMLDTEHMSERELLDELEAAGLDPKKEQAALRVFLDACVDEKKRARLEHGRQGRLKNAARDFLAHVRSLGLSVETLREQIRDLSGGVPATAHRERDAHVDERAMLEQQLADLLALKERDEKG